MRMMDDKCDGKRIHFVNKFGLLVLVVVCMNNLFLLGFFLRAQNSTKTWNKMKKHLQG